MERVRTNGAELDYDVSGTGEPVVCIHGVLIADAFRPLLTEPVLAGRYRFIHYHRRGYAGSTPVARSIGIDEQAADCRALLRHLNVDRAHVVAHSYGGAIALQLALDAPAMVESLTLLEPALIVGATGPAYRESLARGTERYREVGAEVIVDEFLEARWPAYRPVLDRALTDAFAQAVADAATTFEYEVPALLDWHFGETEARRIDQPTLSLLGGETDTLMPRFGETHRLLLAWLPRAEGVVLPGVTHLMQIENPRATAEALAAFLARHPIH